MEFGTPPRNIENYPNVAFGSTRLRAQGSLDYLQFITLVRNLWAEGHPDIPIRPSQSKKYSKYPVIVYGLEMRKTHTSEPKKRYRETEYREDSDTHLVVSAQRFDNVITFTVLTEGNPELCEAIVETFESFMMESTPIFKELGVSDFFYTRRLPDREQTRKDEDVEERAVSYLVVLEKITITEVDKIKEIIVKARLLLQQYWNGSEFWCANPEDEDAISQYISCPGTPFRIGDIIILRKPSHQQDTYQNGVLSFAVPQALPEGLFAEYQYQILNVDDDNIYLGNLDGSPVAMRSNGMGTISGAKDLSGLIKATIIDDFQAATPND